MIVCVKLDDLLRIGMNLLQFSLVAGGGSVLLVLGFVVGPHLIKLPRKLLEFGKRLINVSSVKDRAFL